MFCEMLFIHLGACFLTSTNVFLLQCRKLQCLFIASELNVCSTFYCILILTCDMHLQRSSINFQCWKLLFMCVCVFVSLFTALVFVDIRARKWCSQFSYIEQTCSVLVNSSVHQNTLHNSGCSEMNNFVFISVTVGLQFRLTDNFLDV